MTFIPAHKGTDDHAQWHMVLCRPAVPVSATALSTMLRPAVAVVAALRMLQNAMTHVGASTLLSDASLSLPCWPPSERYSLTLDVVSSRVAMAKPSRRRRRCQG